MPRNPRQARKPAQINRDSLKISELYKSGATQIAIASELGISQATVSREITKLEEYWLEEGINNIDAAKARELAKLDQLELIHMNAWLRSQQDAVKTVEGESAGKFGGPYSSTTREGQVGDPRFLDGVMDCIKQRCAILGVEAPKKIAPTNPAGDEPVNITITYQDNAS